MTLKQLQKLCHTIAIEKGFWDEDDTLEKYFIGQKKDTRNNGEMIALMHSELSEALEELRKEKCNIKLVAEELADCVIRILDFCEGRGIDLDKAINKIVKRNKKRPYKHGKKF